MQLAPIVVVAGHHIGSDVGAGDVRGVMSLLGPVRHGPGLGGAETASEVQAHGKGIVGLGNAVRQAVAVDVDEVHVGAGVAVHQAVADAAGGGDRARGPARLLVVKRGRLGIGNAELEVPVVDLADIGGSLSAKSIAFG